MVGGPDAQRAEIGRQAPPNVTVRPAVDSAGVPDLLSSFDVALAPYGEAIEIASSSIDTARWMSPMKLVEYMSAGKAIIASRLPAVKELVRDGRQALLAPPGDMDAWLAAIDRLDDLDTRGALSAAARQRYLASLSWDQRARSIFDRLPELVVARPSARREPAIRPRPARVEDPG